jgi:hypothetical protein
MKPYKLVNKIPVQVETLQEAKWERVAEHLIENVFVSTVFLALDHSFESNIPVLFETMIFGGKYDQYQDRYSTWDEAIQGHEIAVNLVKQSLCQEDQA